MDAEGGRKREKRKKERRWVDREVVSWMDGSKVGWLDKYANRKSESENEGGGERERKKDR